MALCTNPPAPGQRCGQCDGCWAHRRYLWISRIEEESLICQRTWFITLTFAVTPKTRSDVVSSFQRYMKRLREQVGSLKKMRYLAVVERGTAHSRLHLHALIHGPNTLSYRNLKQAWQDGFFHGKLVSSHARFYITKYVTKESGRVLASKRYGYLNSSTESPSIRVQSETLKSLANGLIQKELFNPTSPTDAPTRSTEEPIAGGAQASTANTICHRKTGLGQPHHADHHSAPTVETKSPPQRRS